MKNLILLILCSVVFSCGIRTKKTNKEKESINTSENIQISDQNSLSSSTESKIDLSDFLKQSGLNITSSGKPFKLSYNGINFEGDANIEFNQKDRKITLISVRKVNVTYKSKMTYKSLTKHKTIYHKKNIDLKSERSSWWLYVLISFASAVVGIYIWENYIRNLKILKNGKTIDT